MYYSIDASAWLVPCGERDSGESDTFSRCQAAEVDRCVRDSTLGSALGGWSQAIGGGAGGRGTMLLKAHLQSRRMRGMNIHKVVACWCRYLICRGEH